MRVIFFLFFIIIFASCATPQQTSSMDENITYVDFAYVKSIVDNLDKNGTKETIIFDARDDKKYAIGHLPTAKLLTLRNFDKEFEMYKQLPKDTPMLVYCSSKNCNQSREVSKKISQEGFGNIKVYLDGISNWLDMDMYFEITKSMADNLNKMNEALFIDLKSEEYNSTEYANNTLKIPFETFDINSSLLPEDKSSIIVIFDTQNSKRVYTIANKMAEQKYFNLKVLNDYVETVETNDTQDTNTTSKYIKSNTKYIVDTNWFINTIASEQVDTNITIIDVRTQSEYKSGHIKDAINIPYDYSDQSKKLYEQIKDIKGGIVFYCSTGTRSYETILDMKSYKPSNFYEMFYLDANVVCDEQSNCQITPNATIDF